MHTYTLAFIKKNDEILMLNRNKSPWMGSWNGVGGKIQPNETPLEGIIREVLEETNIDVSTLKIEHKGILTWENFDAIGSGLYIFLIDVDSKLDYLTPIQTDEGILDWKKIEWINDFNNKGVAENIPYFLPSVLNDELVFHYHCIFKGKYLEKVIKTQI